jgi:hypothetical protein
VPTDPSAPAAPLALIVANGDATREAGAVLVNFYSAIVALVEGLLMGWSGRAPASC